MKIGIRNSPHLEAVVQGLKRHGETLVDPTNTGCDLYITWGWPQMQDVKKHHPAWVTAPTLTIDAHPFALRKGDTSGSRIFQLNNWGALADYPGWTHETRTRINQHMDPDGPALILGQVGSTEQKRGELVDVWYTPGYERWRVAELAKPNTKFRMHPREWVIHRDGEKQPSLEEDLIGCSRVLSWNSTAAIHARMLGYPAVAAEDHGWAHMDLGHLVGLQAPLNDLRTGKYWDHYRGYLSTFVAQRRLASASA